MLPGNYSYLNQVTGRFANDQFSGPGQHNHNHTVEVGAATAAKIVSRVKSKALEEKFKSASAIVDEVTIHSFLSIA